MPIAVVLHFAVAIFFAVHAVRSGKDRYWLMVLFAFPLLGSIVYFFAEYSRELKHTRGGRRAMRLMQGVLNPDRELRFAREEFDRTPTAFNEAQLARALLAKGEVEQAIAHYRHCVSGPYARDASFLKGLAIALLEAGQHAAAVNTLETLLQAHPDQRKGDLALMHAEALAGAGRPEADAAFAQVIATDSSIEARCKYAQFLAAKGQADGARREFEQVLADARRSPAHARDMNREWIAHAKAALQQRGG